MAPRGPFLPTLDDATQVNRREFVGVATWGAIAAALAACGGGKATGPGGGPGTGPGGGNNGGITLPAGVTVAGSVVTIDLAQQPALTAANGFLLIPTTDTKVFVIHVGTAFRAFTSICTHQQCDVNSFNGTRILCPCHGSQYDINGKPVAGPAPDPLREFTAQLNSANNTLTVTKS